MTERRPARQKPGRGTRGVRARFRRSACLVLYWQDGELVFENFALRTKMSADPLLCSLLGFCTQWRSFREVAAYLSEFDEASILENLIQLCANGVLERSDQERDPRLDTMERWAPWNPAAGFFHFSTKDTRFAPDPKRASDELKRRARHDPMPLPVKSYPRATRTKLPRVWAAGEFPEILKSRRTWRKYGRKAVTLETLAQLLQLTFGIQGWVNVPGLGPAAMKTSPSGGDLHPIEAYVLAQRVTGLKRGLYHYNAARHELERLHPGLTRTMVSRNLGNQSWFAEGAFLVLMTAVFGRTQWKYDFPRAYRVVLAEAGHLGQSFCLTATWLGLAPFCTMAQTDTKWEKWLGIDGVNESMLYIAGAGTRPVEMAGAHIGELGEGTASKPRKRLRSLARTVKS